MKKVLFFFAFLLLIVPSFSPTHTKAADIRAITESLSVKIVPEFPKPNDTVSIRIESHSTNLNNSIISWRVSGRELSSGQGNNTVSFVLGNDGLGTEVVVFIQPLTGNSFSKSFFITPTEMDILWEANTYTPPFYKGRPLFTGESEIVLTANPIIHDQAGNLISRDALVYQWKLNGKVLVNQSGYGKSSATITGLMWGRPEKVQVTASIPDGRVSTQKEIVITPTSPNILIYENSPLLGLLMNHAVTDVFALNEAEASFQAIPYFFNNDLLSGNTLFEWKMNGRVLQTTENANQITFRNEGLSSGRSEISINISNPGSIFQRGEESFLIRYGN